MSTYRSAEYVRGADRKHKIIRPIPDAEGKVVVGPGEEIVTEIIIPAGDPLLQHLPDISKASVLLHQTRRSRGAISGMHHDNQQPDIVKVLSDGSVLMTQGARNHNLQRNIVIQDGDELSAVGIMPEETFAMRNDTLLHIVESMRIPTDHNQPVLLGTDKKTYSLEQAKALLAEGNTVEFVEVGIPLQEKVGLLSHGPDIQLGKVRRAWQGLEEDIGLVWTNLNDKTGQQAIAQGVILQLTVPLVIPKGFVAVIQNGILQPHEPEHGDSAVLAPEWKAGNLQEVITEHQVHKGETGIEIPRMIRVKFFRDSKESADISHAFEE